MHMVRIHNLVPDSVWLPKWAPTEKWSNIDFRRSQLANQ
jgi:hypothetical protein